MDLVSSILTRGYLWWRERAFPGGKTGPARLCPSSSRFHLAVSRWGVGYSALQRMLVD